VNRFCHYELRTTDVDAARAFYRTVLGPGFWHPGIEPAPLPAAAVARGAVPHWLGHIRVDDVSATTQRFITRGATQLGPAVGAVSTLRDPSGAVLALSSGACAEDDPVVWHVLHAHDERAASAAYADIFGWGLPSAAGVQPIAGHQPLTWRGASAPAGIVTNSAQIAGVHAHWLFFFPTVAQDRAVEAVRANGGRTLPIVTAYGQRLAPCEDAQGAAFGLSQRIVW
jgi:predicted enzyme related to lactoylglutathione lyase